MDLAKADKKIVKKLINLGAEREKTIYIYQVDNIILDFKTNKTGVSDCYGKAYSSVVDNDKKIARKYDGLSGSRYYDIVLDLFIHNIVSDEEIKGFSPEVYKKLIQHKEYFTGNE